MTTYQALVDIFDETFSALSSFDLDKLQALEFRIALLVESTVRFEADEIRGAFLKKRQLEILLQNCQVNLDALSRLHVRNMGNQWAQ
jgi:hypothetical protein